MSKIILNRLGYYIFTPEDGQNIADLDKPNTRHNFFHKVMVRNIRGFIQDLEPRDCGCTIAVSVAAGDLNLEQSFGNIFRFCVTPIETSESSHQAFLFYPLYIRISFDSLIRDAVEVYHTSYTLVRATVARVCLPISLSLVRRFFTINRRAGRKCPIKLLSKTDIPKLFNQKGMHEHRCALEQHLDLLSSYFRKCSTSEIASLTDTLIFFHYTKTMLDGHPEHIHDLEYLRSLIRIG